MGSHRWLLANAAVTVSVAIATAAGVALASDGSPAQPARTTATTQAGAPSGIQAAAHHALQLLVNQGTINQTQADAIQRQVNAGSVDPKTLVNNRVVTDTQMRAVANSLDQVKQAAGH